MPTGVPPAAPSSTYNKTIGSTVGSFGASRSGFGRDSGLTATSQSQQAAANVGKSYFSDKYFSVSENRLGK